MSEDNNNHEELRRFAEQGMPGVWYLCPRCMSKDVWMISCEFKKQSKNHMRSRSFIIGSLCEKCKFYELDPDMGYLGMDQIDWKLVADNEKIF